MILVGNVTRDPQVKYTAGGTAVAEIGLAVNREWFDKQSNQKKTDVTFVDVSVFGRTAEVVGEYLTKGSQVLFEGRLQLDQWDDATTGQKRSKLRVIAEQMTMLGSQRSGDQRQEQPRQTQPSRQQERPQPSRRPGENPRHAAHQESPQHGAPPPDDEVPF